MRNGGVDLAFLSFADKEMKIIFVNIKLLKLTGYTSKDLIGLNVQKLMPSDVAKVR